MILNINTNANIILTAKLERLKKSALPNAIRSTLSDSAFEMKKFNILDSAKKNMKVKNQNFFKANTGVIRAVGNNVNQMEATSGFVNKRGEKANKAVNYGMEANETGNTDVTGLKYYSATRGSRGMVKRSQYYDEKNVSDTYSDDKPFMAKAYASLKEKKAVFVNTKKGRALIKVSAISRYKRANKKKGVSKGQGRITSKLLMMDRTHKKAKAKATHFNKEAAIKTSKQIEGFYKKNAEFQLNKIWR